jgi:hypothetical protein
MILGDFTGEFGDRRQEIVFIGRGMDREGISARLDTALLTDEEMEKYKANWASARDPDHSEALRGFQERKKEALAAAAAAAAAGEHGHGHAHAH